MFEKLGQQRCGMRLGWISLIMCIPIYVLALKRWFDWEWMTGAPYILFYIWRLISGVSLPILIILQLFIIGKFWIEKRTLSLNLLAFLILTTILYVYPTRGFWAGNLGLE